MCQLSCMIYFDQNAKQKDETAGMPQMCSVPTCSKTQLDFVLQDLAYIQDSTAQPASLEQIGGQID